MCPSSLAKHGSGLGACLGTGLCSSTSLSHLDQDRANEPLIKGGRSTKNQNWAEMQHGGMCTGSVLTLGLRSKATDTIRDAGTDTGFTLAQHRHYHWHDHRHKISPHVSGQKLQTLSQPQAKGRHRFRSHPGSQVKGYRLVTLTG